MAFIEIVKAENGNIYFNGLTGTNGKVKGLTFNGNFTINQKDTDAFDIKEGSDLVYTFLFSQVISTQIMPDPAVPIGVTTADDFFALMRESFFFKPIASSGGEETASQTTLFPIANTVAPIMSITLPANSNTVLRVAVTAKLAGAAQNYKAEFRYGITCSSGGVVTAGVLASASVENFAINLPVALDVSAPYTFRITGGRSTNTSNVEFQTTYYATIHTYTI